LKWAGVGQEKRLSLGRPPCSDPSERRNRILEVFWGMRRQVEDYLTLADSSSEASSLSFLVYIEIQRTSSPCVVLQVPRTLSTHIVLSTCQKFPVFVVLCPGYFDIREKR
jgi:hypothetical protein